MNIKVGDAVLDKLCGVESEVVYILPNSNNVYNIVIRHLGDKSDYLTSRDMSDLIPIHRCVCKCECKH